MHLILNDNLIGSKRKFFKLSMLDNLLKKDLSKYFNYYAYYEGKVDNSNILVRAIKLLVDDIRTDPSNKLEYYLNNARYIAKQLEITDTYNRGDYNFKLLNNSGNLETIVSIYTNSVFNINKDNWFLFKPLKCIYSNNTIKGITDLYNSDLEFTDIYEIDIAGLALQYHYWAIFRDSLNQSIDPAIFIRQQVIPKLLIDYLNHYRLDLIFNIENRELDKYHIPISIANRVEIIEKELLSIRENLKKQNHMNFYMLLESIPLLYDTGYTFLEDDITDSKHVDWIYSLKAFKYIKSLILEFPNTITASKDILSKYRILMRSVKNENLEPFLPYEEIFSIYLEEVDELLRGV